MKFRVEERRIRKQNAPHGKHRKPVYIIQWRRLFGRWKNLYWGDKNEHGEPLMPLFHRYVDAKREADRLADVNFMRIFGKPKIK